MTDLKEIKEAREALLDLREEIDLVIKETESASRWESLTFLQTQV